jgi:SAM-dependent methyltransferase
MKEENKSNSNYDSDTVAGFGDEWVRFDQRELSRKDAENYFNNYFSIFPWDHLDKTSIGFDLGCGSGRWARLVAPRVGTLHCIDPSKALVVARKNLETFSNCFFHSCGVGNLDIPNKSMDFGYSLGVLHHVPDTARGIRDCVSKLKPGAPFLIYLYYNFDNRPFWFRCLWGVSNLLRILISRFSFRWRYWTSQAIACFIYFPLAKIALFCELLGGCVDNFPLSAYRNVGFYVMRTDALDRFGTRLEQRFSKDEILKMMTNAGLVNILFSDKVPYWCAVGYAKSE